MNTFAFNKFVSAYEFIKYLHYYFNNVQFRGGPQIYLDNSSGLSMNIEEIGLIKCDGKD